MPGLIQLNSLTIRTVTAEGFLEAQNVKYTECTHFRQTCHPILTNICVIIIFAVKPQWPVFVCHRCRTVSPKTHSHTKKTSFFFTSGHTALVFSLTHPTLSPVGCHSQCHITSLSKWQIWNNKRPAETPTTRCLCHPFLHASFDKADKLGTVNCLLQCYRRPLQCFFF